MAETLPPLNWLRVFAAAGRHLSFTRAAAELNITQSAVSQQVRALEQHLGEPLFHRLPRSIQLTDAGRLYLPKVEETFEGLRRSTEEVFRPRARGQLNVKVNTAFALLWLAPRLPDFARRHPEIRLRQIYANWMVDFEWSSVELEIRHGPGNWPGYRVELLAASTLGPLCAPGLAAELRTPADLRGRLLIEVMGNSQGWKDWLAAAGLEAAVELTPRYQVDSSSLAYALAERGTGVALGRSVLAEGHFAEGRLAAPFGMTLPAADDFYLVRRPEQALSPEAEAFRAWLLETASGGP
jgi:LysR family glycine cleavage system transcriptional activator